MQSTNTTLTAELSAVTVLDKCASQIERYGSIAAADAETLRKAAVILAQFTSKPQPAPDGESDRADRAEAKLLEVSEVVRSNGSATALQIVKILAAKATA